MMNTRLVSVLVLLGVCVFSEGRHFDGVAFRTNGIAQEIAQEIAPNNENDGLLLEGSKKMNDFVNSTGLTSFTDFYLFNVLNSKELVDSAFSVKPILKEVGPFRFKETFLVQPVSREKKSEVFGFFQKHFVYDGNPALLDEKITILNVPLAVIYMNAKYIKRYHPDEKFANRVYKILDRLPLFLELTVGEILLGYKADETLNALAEIARIYKEIHTRMIFHGFFSIVNGDLVTYKGLTFSIAHYRDVATWDFFTLKTGVPDLKSLGEIFKIMKKDVNPTWPLCPKDDTNSNGFGKYDTLLGAQENEKVAVYDSWLRRPVLMEEVLNNRTNAGRTVRKFVRSDRLFASSKEYPKYKCYRSEPEYDRTDILKAGSEFGPIVNSIHSEPHFWAEKSGDFGWRFEGLHPNRSDYESFMEIKADTGELLYARNNLQTNIDINISDRYGKQFILPLYWKSSVTVRDRS